MPSAGTLTKPKKKTWGATLWDDVGGRGKKKTKNSDFAEDAKAEIRQNVLDEIGPSCARVMDLFAGEGEMHARVWHRASVYVGCDLEWPKDKRKIFVVDNRRLMRSIDLSGFNVFDLDHYGSPWEHALLLTKVRPVANGERVGLILTEGSNFKVRMGGLPMALSVMAGMKNGMGGAGTSHDEIIDRALCDLYERWGVKQIRRWQARHRTGSQMRYIALVLEGVGHLPPETPIE